MSQSHMKVFNEYVMPEVIEALAQKVKLFNAASGGALRLSTTGFDGDFASTSFFQSLAAAQRRVDRYGANGDVTPTNITQEQENAVKIAGGFGPILYEPSQMTWLQKPTATGISVAAKSFADVLISDQLNTALAALVAALENNAAVVNDVSASAGMSYGAVNGAHAKFGDTSGSLITSFMTGTVSHHFIGQNITNDQRLFTAGNINVIDILGKLVVVTDAPSLYEAGTPNKSKVLTLVPGASSVTNTADIITNVDTNNGKDRIETTFQADYTFGLAMKGYAWDMANGGKSPSDAEIATGTNWDQTAGDIKHTAGVITIGDADQ